MVKIPLRDRLGVVVAHALVDGSDADRVMARRWHRTARGYVGHCAGELLHRFVMGLAPGDGRYVDHINHDRLDNRRSNLRVVSNAENMQNRSPRRLGTSRHRGVCYCKQTGRWKAQAMLNGQGHFLGRYATEEEAARVATAFRVEHMPCAEDVLEDEAPPSA